MKTYFRIYHRDGTYRIAAQPWFWPFYTWISTRDYSSLERAIVERDGYQRRCVPWKPVIEAEPLDSGI